MNVISTLYEILFVRPELRLTHRLEKPGYLSSVKASYAVQVDYLNWLNKQCAIIEKDITIAQTIGWPGRVERISRAQKILKDELDSLQVSEPLKTDQVSP